MDAGDRVRDSNQPESVCWGRIGRGRRGAFDNDDDDDDDRFDR